MVMRDVEGCMSKWKNTKKDVYEDRNYIGQESVKWVINIGKQLETREVSVYEELT